MTKPCQPQGGSKGKRDSVRESVCESEGCCSSNLLKNATRNSSQVSAACRAEVNVIKPVKAEITRATKMDRWVEGRWGRTKNVSQQSARDMEDANATESTWQNDSLSLPWELSPCPAPNAQGSLKD